MISFQKQGTFLSLTFCQIIDEVISSVDHNCLVFLMWLSAVKEIILTSIPCIMKVAITCQPIKGTRKSSPHERLRYMCIIQEVRKY